MMQRMIIFSYLKNPVNSTTIYKKIRTGFMNSKAYELLMNTKFRL